MNECYQVTKTSNKTNSLDLKQPQNLSSFDSLSLDWGRRWLLRLFFYITLSLIHLTVLSARFSFNLHLSFFPNPFNEWMVFWFFASWTSSNTFEGYNQLETSSIKGEKHTLFDHWNYPSKTLAAVFSIGTTNESIILHPFLFFHFILFWHLAKLMSLDYNIIYLSETQNKPTEFWIEIFQLYWWKYFHCNRFARANSAF